MKTALQDKERLEHIIEAIAFIRKHTMGISREAFEENELLPFAIAKNIEIIGEASNNITRLHATLLLRLNGGKLLQRGTSLYTRIMRQIGTLYGGL